MRILPQLSGKPDLARFAAAFSRDVNKHLATVQRAADAQLRRRANEQEARARAEREKQEREAPLIAARIKLARKGFERLKALGQSEPMRQILDSLQRISRINDHITLYEVSRPSGDDWELNTSYGATRTVMVELYQDRLQIFSGAWLNNTGGEGRLLQSGYMETSSFEPEDGACFDIEKFLSDTAVPYPANLSLVRHWNQRSYEWDPDDVAFQFLVSCARKLQFERYVKECMSGLGKKLSGHFN